MSRHPPLPTKIHIFSFHSTSNSFPNPPQNPTIYAPSAEARIRQQGGARAHLNSPLLVCPARGASSPTRRLQSSFGCPSTDCTARFWPRRLPARRIDSSILTPGLPASEACPLALARRHASAPPPSPCLLGIGVPPPHRLGTSCHFSISSNNRFSPPPSLVGSAACARPQQQQLSHTFLQRRQLSKSLHTCYAHKSLDSALCCQLSLAMRTRPNRTAAPSGQHEGNAHCPASRHSP